MEEAAKRETKKCPACAEFILAEAIKCKHCGERLEVTSNAPPPPVPALKPSFGRQRAAGRKTQVLVGLAAGILVAAGAVWLLHAKESGLGFEGVGLGTSVSQAIATWGQPTKTLNGIDYTTVFVWARRGEPYRVSVKAWNETKKIYTIEISFHGPCEDRVRQLLVTRYGPPQSVSTNYWKWTLPNKSEGVGADVSSDFCNVYMFQPDT